MEIKNWADNITLRPHKFVSPTSISEVADAIEVAEREGRQVRAFGSGWSFTDVTHTNDVLLDVSRLDRLLALSQGRTAFRDESPVLTNSLRDDVLNSDRRLAHVQSGITIRALYNVLDKRDDHPGDRLRNRWALFTQGGAGGQTLAGALSTGTHGADLGLPPIADWVRSIHLVGPGGVQHWIEPAGSAGITDRTRLQRMMPELHSENIHYDDDWFNAVLVSMGNMGIIVSFVIEVSQQFGLSQRVVATRWREVRRLLEVPAAFGTGIFSPSLPLGIRHPDIAAGRRVNAVPAGLEILLNPYRVSDDYLGDRTPDRDCLLVSRARAIPLGAGERGFDDAPVVPPGDHFHSFWHAIFDTLAGAAGVIALESGGPGTVKDIINTIMGRSRSDTRGYPVSYSVLDTYDYGAAKPPVMSMELVIATTNNQHIRLIERLLAVFDELIQRGEGRKFAGALSIRFTRPSRAFLAMQHPGVAGGRNPICHIEIFGLKELDALGHVVHDGNMEGLTDEFMLAFERVAHTMGARLHWGQINMLNRARVERAYPETIHSWRRIRTEIVAAGKSSTFSNWFSRRCGLEPYTEVLTATSWGPNRFDIFGYNGKGDVLQLWWTPGWTWSTLRNQFAAGERFVGPLTAASWGANRIDIFGLSKRGTILQLWWDGSWHWTDLSASLPTVFRSDIRLTGLMAAAASEASRIELFCLTSTGEIQRYWYSSRGWQTSNLGNRFPGGERIVGSIAAVSDGSGRIHLFGLGTRGQVLQLWRNGGTAADPVWVWSDLGSIFPPDQFVIAGPLAASSVRADRIDVFAQGINGDLITLTWNGRWTGQAVASDFPARIRKLGMQHEFGEPSSIDSYYKYEERNGVEDRFVGPITAVASAGSLHVFGFGESGSVLQAWRESDTYPWNWSDLDNGWERNRHEVTHSPVVDIGVSSDGTESASLQIP